ncbi:non-canonical purine NTP pyrophosphatase [Lichenihabitans sp. PAMC28606]|uniref:non-canonical purine NTP pyrophosphatase n=1 Tax=Lichenihabitans sp. PAMC28606 TaxID=2880932 RepID=UPI001D0B6C18|nr:non-canonical purine NTP pyrophosphatase [Lichenihabitans sp. PAMC28606]UDL93318.1 non-canonical purine NTP pyrophosphatase [Lichenihabitans sp. PAMC28606]
MPPITRLVLATHNAAKVAEFRDLFAPHAIEIVSAGDLGLPEPDETGTTFVANAELKAEAAALASGLPALADDSGLCVDGLGGDPGIYSARWAGKPADFPAVMARIDAMLTERGLMSDAQRRAHFVAVLSVVWPDRQRLTVEGKVFGTVVPPRGILGFGYDPMFRPDGHDKTFGEMTAMQKHGIPIDGSQALSHRARAFQLLAAQLFTAR